LVGIGLSTGSFWHKKDYLGVVKGVHHDGHTETTVRGPNGPQRNTKFHRATGVPSDTLFARNSGEINDLQKKNR
jgi:hypothetical protein